MRLKSADTNGVYAAASAITRHLLLDANTLLTPTQNEHKINLVRNCGHMSNIVDEINKGD